MQTGKWKLKWEPSFQWMTYAALAEEVQRVAFGLQQHLPQNSKVGICGRNSPAWIVMEYGCMWAGMVSVPLSGEWDAQVLQHVWQSCALSALAADSNLLPDLLRVRTSFLATAPALINRSVVDDCLGPVLLQ